MTIEKFQQAIDIQREYESTYKSRKIYDELSSNLYLQAEAYGCGQRGKDIAETASECVKIFFEQSPEDIMEMCQVLIEWSDKKKKKCDEYIEKLKNEVKEL